MTTIGAIRDVGNFQGWLNSLPREVKLGAALSTDQDTLGIASSDGTVWAVKLHNRDLAAAIINTLRNAGRRVWAERATPMTLALSTVSGEPIEDLSTFVCLRVLRKAVAPDAEPAELTGKPAPFRARVAAVEAHQLQENTRLTMRRAALASVETDLIWRARQQKGWSVDVSTLQPLASNVWTERRSWRTKLAIDLCKDDAATFEWIASQNITLGMKKGKPSLSHSEWASAIVPPQSREAWADFQTVRDLKSSTDQLRMITNRVHNNRLFSEIWILGARTGRTTSKNSALQNVTKPIRHVFRAEPGEVLIGIDIDRAEVALAALASGDEILSQDLRAGDLYMAQARRVHGPTASQEHRTAFKTAMLAIFFGQGHTATARKLGITEEAVSQMVGAMRSRWTKLFALVESTKTAVQHGYNRHTISGRALPALTPSESYIGFNHLTQGGSADLFNAGCIRVADALGAALYGGGRREGSKHLWLPIHDELICSVPADRAEEMLQVLETAMSTEINGVRIGGTAKLLGLAWRKTD